MIDPIQDLYQRTRPTYRRGERLLDTESAAPVEAVTPSGFKETFARGFGAGVEGIRTDTDYFKGLYNTITGDDEAAAINIQTAKAREARIAESLSGLETFKEFIDNPTLSGLLTQTAKIGGQVAPYALTTIGSGGAGAVATVISKGALTAGSRAIAKNVVKESIERTVKGEATPDERDLAEIAYRLARRTVPGKVSTKLTANRGAITGQLLEEYTLMSGANFGENLEIEGLSDQEAAYRALAVAAPQAVIGVAGERVIQNAIFNKLGKITKERGQPGSLMANLGKEIAKATGKGAVGESVAETAQEGLQIANLAQVDPNFSSEDALLRLGEAAFSGAIGGGQMSGAGRTVTGSLQTSGAIFEKVGEYIQNAREQGITARYNREQYGIDEDGITTPEPQSHMNAQLRSLLDQDTERSSLWVAGTEPAYGASKEGKVGAVNIENQTFYTAYIPGRGTILSKFEDVTQAVKDAEASNESLQLALKYSAVKPEDASISIEARDRDGNVVWAEATNEAGVDAAYEAARKQTPEGGSQTRQSIKKALEERATLVEKEQGPQVRNIDMPDDSADQELDEFGEGTQIFENPAEENIGNQDSYTPRQDGTSYQNTETARQEFAEAFRETDLPDLGKSEFDGVDFSVQAFASMSDSFLQQAAKLKRQDPNSDIFVVQNPDGSHSIKRMGVPGQKEARPSTLVRLRDSIALAARSAYAKKKKVLGNWQNKAPSELVTIDGTPVNLIDIVKDGQRQYSIEEGVQFTEGGNNTAQRNGLLTALATIIESGRVVKIGGYDIRSKQLKDLNELIPLIENEESSIAAAALEWDMDADDPNLQGRLNELLQALDSATAAITTVDRGTYVDKKGKTRNKVRDTSKEARRNSPLDRLKIQRKAWGQAYAAYLQAVESGDNTATPPEKPPLLALMDVPAGFQDGKPITLGKILNATPNEPTPKDAQYTLTNEDGFKVFTGNKEQVQERIESDGQPYSINKVTRDGLTVLSDEEFANERNLGSNEIVRDAPYTGPIADRAEQRTPPIGFSEETSDANPDYTFEPAQNNVGELGSLGLPENSATTKIVTIARNILRLDKPVSVLSIKELLANDDPSSFFGDEKAAEFVLGIARDLKNNSQGGGRYIGFADAHIILVDPDAASNELQTALVTAHELGHALFNEQMESTLQNPILYNRLYKSFEESRDAKDAPAGYKGKHGFEEWYADQTAIWAIKQYASDRKKGLVGAHFQKIANKLKRFFKALSKDLQTRFGREAYTEGFNDYMGAVMERRRDNVNTNSGAQKATFREKVLVRKMAENVQQNTKPGYVEAIQRQVKQVINSDGFTPIYNMLFTADSRMRKIAGNKMADLFYGRAQDSNNRGRNKLGYVKTSALAGNKWFSRLEKAVGGSLKAEDVEAAFDTAFSNTPTAELTGKPLAIRKWFEELHDEYIAPSNTDIAKRENYTPVVLNLSEIHTRSDVFVELIMNANPNQDLAQVKKSVERLVGYQQNILDGKPVVIKEVNPAESAERALKLTANIKPETLSDAGFVEKPQVATLRYLANVVKRVEWNNNTKDSNGNSIYEEELAKLPPSKQEEVKMIVEKYLGYNTKPLSENWKNVQSALTLMQIVAILPLAVLGSVPELAGPIIASKEFSAVTRGMKEIVNTVKNREEARRLARDIGIVSSQSSANVLMSQAEMEWMNDSARKLTDGFFRVILLDQYTQFTREFAANMGVKFLEEHANPDSQNAFSERYLSQLGLTASDVKTWIDSEKDFTSPEGMKVEEALQRFVESSTLRPNAAERPIWASDPRFALIWQLKGFFYSYGKVMAAGAKREASDRLEGVKEGDVPPLAALGGAASVFALMGIATMPLAMVGMELREYAKYGLAYVLPGYSPADKNYFRTDDMSWPKYMSAAFERSFAFGPASIGHQMMQATDWGRGPFGAVAVALGPTAETAERVITDGIGSTVRNRISPTGLL